MKAVVQRVSSCAVDSEGKRCGAIGPGLCVLLGVSASDSLDDVEWMVQKITGLRIFEDAEGKMNLSLEEVEGALLVISQFTLYGDCRKGRRPSFIRAARPEKAVELYEIFVEKARALGFPVETGVFQTHMSVQISNDGPVTLIIESPSEGGVQ